MSKASYSKGFGASHGRSRERLIFRGWKDVILCIPTTPQRENFSGKYPTQKPLALLKRIVLSSTNNDDLILDPFTGFDGKNRVFLSSFGTCSK